MNNLLYLLIAVLCIAVPLLIRIIKKAPIKNKSAKRLLVIDYLVSVLLCAVLNYILVVSSDMISMIMYYSLRVLLLIAVLVIYPIITKNNREVNDARKFAGGCLIEFLIFIAAATLGMFIAGALKSPIFLTIYCIALIILLCYIILPYIKK